MVWTLVGIGAGFGAGVFLGLHAFDDAINSDRKVWTSAIVGAAAGGLAAGLLSRNVGRAPAWTTCEPASGGLASGALDVGPGPSTSEDEEILRRRVREVSAGAVVGDLR